MTSRRHLQTRTRALRFVGPTLAIVVCVGALLSFFPTENASAAAQRRRPSRYSTTTTTAKPATTTSTTIATTTSSTIKPATTTTTAKPLVTTSTTTQPAAGGGSVLFGAESDDASGQLAELSAFESHAGKKVANYGYFASFYWDQNFNAAKASAIRSRGATPMLTWEPWDPRSGSASQPAYSLAALAGGAYDEYFIRWATQIKAWGQPIWLRFAHEMNGDWYPWAVGVNGNTASQYVAAWRHVVDIFRAAGTTNVSWVWNPNVLRGGENLAAMYPGDAYVDWVGIDGYNFGTSASWSTWTTPQQLFGPTLNAVRAITTRPIAITETASSERGGDKAQWIQAFFSMMRANPDIKAFFWFNLNKETDWRIESSPAAQAAFAAGVADSRYVGA